MTAPRGPHEIFIGGGPWYSGHGKLVVTMLNGGDLTNEIRLPNPEPDHVFTHLPHPITETADTENSAVYARVTPDERLMPGSRDAQPIYWV